MEKLKSKAEDLASSLSDARFDLRARENLLLEIFYELGNLPMLPNNGLNISEVLGVEVIKFDQREQLTIRMELEWTKRFENYVCALIQINNESDFPGLVKCAVDKFKTEENECGFVDMKYFFLTDNNEVGSQSYINAKTLRQLLVAIPIEYFQNSHSNCALIIDWVILSLEILPELKCAPQIHARIDTKFAQKFAPFNYSFDIFYPLNGWPFSKCIEDALELDAINIFHCICLTKHQQSLNYSSTDLHSLLELSLNEHFKIIDFGSWQIAFGNEFSKWSNIFIYIAPDDNNERYLPKSSIIFGSNDFEVHNFNKYLNQELYFVSN